MKLASFLSKNTPVNGWNDSEDLNAIRRKILTFVFLAAVVVASAAFFTTIFTFMQSREWLIVGVRTLILAVFVFLVLANGLSLKARAFCFLLALIVMATSEMLAPWLGGDGRVFLIVVTLLAVILLDLRAALVTFAIAAVLLIITPGLMRGGVIPTPELLKFEDTVGLNVWITGSVVIMGVAGLTIITLNALIRGMQQAVARQRALAQDLQHEHGVLEERVQERTAAIEHRAVMIQHVANFSHAVQKCSGVEEIAALLVRTFQQDMSIANVAVLLADKRANGYVLADRAGALSALALEATGAFWGKQPGSLALLFDKRETVVVRNAGENSLYFALPGFDTLQTIILLPMFTEQACAGAVVLFFDREPDSEDGQLTVYQSLANQAEIALEKAGLLTELQRNVEELRVRGQQVTRKDWRGYIKSSRQNHALRYNGQKIETNAPRSLSANQAFRERRTVVQEESGGETRPVTTVAVPIMLRDEPFGVVDMRFEGSVPDNLVNLVDAASRRLALALENARLVEQMQARAEREHAISAMAARIRASGDIDTILKVSAAEIGRSFGASEVLVQLRATETSPEAQPVEQS